MRWMVLLLLVAPTAQAFTLQLDTPQVPADRLAPDTGVHAIVIPWTIRCTAGTPPVAESAVLTPSTVSPHGLQWQGRSSYAVDMPDCVTTTETHGDIDFKVSATDEAAGLLPLTTAVEARLSWSDVEARAHNASTEVVTVVAYLGLIQADATAKIRQGAPGSTSTFLVNVTNHGNAPSFVRVELDDADATAPERWPDRSLDRGESQTLEVRYPHRGTAGYDNDQSSFRVLLTPVAAEADAPDGQPVEVNFLARTRSDLKMPAAPLLGVVGLMALAAWARR